MSASTNLKKPDDLEWIPARDDELFNEEGFIQKLTRKSKENPFVPVGAAATVGCLTYGLVSMNRGDSRMQQIMMRSRIVAQGFTVAAVCIGLLYATSGKGKTE